MQFRKSVAAHSAQQSKNGIAFPSNVFEIWADSQPSRHKIGINWFPFQFGY